MRTLLLFLAIVSGAFAFADNPSVRCMQLLSEAQSILNLSENIRAHGRNTMKHMSKQSTVQLKGELVGRHGGKILIFERIGEHWVSDYRTVRYDPQGDLRSFISLLGEEAAAFFGFKMISEKRIQVPDATEFMGAVAKINAYLESKNIPPIPLSYYTTDSNENVRVALYIKKFIDILGIPLAQSGNHLLHDLDFHTGAIFIPAELLELKRTTDKYLEDFISFLEQKFGQDQAKAVRYFSYLWRMRETINIDSATGSVTVSLIIYLHNPEHENVKIFLNGLVDALANEGRSPKELLDYFIKDLDNYLAYMDLGKFRALSNYQFSTYEKAEAHLQILPHEKLLSALGEFAATHPLSSDLLNKFEATKLQSVKDQYCEEMTARRMLIREAAITLARELPPEPQQGILRRLFKMVTR